LHLYLYYILWPLAPDNICCIFLTWYQSKVRLETFATSVGLLFPCHRRFPPRLRSLVGLVGLRWCDRVLPGLHLLARDRPRSARRSLLGLESSRPSASLLSAWICSPCLDLLALIAPASICLASDPVAQPRSSCRGHQGSPRSEQRRRAAYPRESVAAGGPVTSGLPFRLNFLQNSFVLPRSGLSQCSISRCCPDLGGIGRSLQAQIQIQL
jgi:hypothetical protein